MPNPSTLQLLISRSHLHLVTQPSHLALLCPLCVRVRSQPEKLPLLSRLRQDAMQMRARQAQLSTAHTDVIGLRLHLHRTRRLLSLIKRREKLKAQVAALHQAHFEACVKQRKAGFEMAPVMPARPDAAAEEQALSRALGVVSPDLGLSADFAAPLAQVAKSELPVFVDEGALAGHRRGRSAIK